jgi:aspartyl-tRNA(Asn)/glutamyl-tRNA(Gln) amidotransferase subunit A
MTFMAMGTDTGGSIRIPAAYCGTVGFKPTFGRVSRYGMLPLGLSLDHAGPLARSVRDAAVTFAAIVGQDPRDDTTWSAPQPSDVFHASGVRGLRIGVPEDQFFRRIDSAVDAAVRNAIRHFEQLGAHVFPVQLPDLAALNAVARVILLCEASGLLERHMKRRELFGADVLALLDQGRMLPATDYINAQKLRRRMMDEFNEVWRTADCLAMPATPNTAPLIGQKTVHLGGDEEDTRLAATRLMRGINALGWPALSLPCGLVDGLPAAVQIAGPPYGDAVVLRAGAALEDALGPRVAPHLASPS